MLFSLLKHLELFIANTALKVSRSFTVSPLLYLSVEKFFPRLWGTGISDAIFLFSEIQDGHHIGFVVSKMSIKSLFLCQFASVYIIFFELLYSTTWSRQLLVFPKI